MSYSYKLHIFWEGERMAHNMTRVYPDPKGKIHPSNPPFPKKINGFGLFYSGELRIFDFSGSFLLEGQDMSLMKALVKEWVRSVKYHQSTRPSPLAYSYQFWPWRANEGKLYFFKFDSVSHDSPMSHMLLVMVSTYNHSPRKKRFILAKTRIGH